MDTVTLTSLYNTKKVPVCLCKVFELNVLEVIVFEIFVIRNGPEWWRLRSEFQKGLSSPSNVRNFLPDTDNITNEFVSKIMDTSVEKDVPDFMLMLLRLNLERKFYQ